ncbi:MAG: IS4 family transposase, partial [Waddliaceae bacterium]
TKGAYRFFDSPEVTHETLQKVHNENVVEIAGASSRMVLFIQDGSELIYNQYRCTSMALGLQLMRSGRESCFIRVLAVEWSKDSPAVTIGVAKQTAWIRPEPSEETKSNDQKEKESLVRLNTLKAIGRPPVNSRWVSVGDRGNDIYAYISGATDEGWDYALRAKHDRIILVDGEKKRLHKWVGSLEPKGRYELDLRARGEKFSRQAELKITWGEAVMQPSNGKKGKAVDVTYVRAYDPEDEDPEWILTTSLKVNSVEGALGIVQIYEQRWIIEEYHKCLKTGCRIEDAQLKAGKRLLALLGILGVVATQLLKLRDLGRQQPDRLAEELVEKEIVDIVKKKFTLTGEISLKELWRRIAMMGGFLGRKSDGNPGWQTIWKGRLHIQDMLEGMALVKNCG